MPRVPPGQLYGVPGLGSPSRHGGLYGIPHADEPRIIASPVGSLSFFNATSGSVPQVPKVGFLLGITSNDNSVTDVPTPSLTGWVFQQIDIINATSTMSVALWVGRPNESLILAPSGATLSITANNFSGADFRHFVGDFKGEVIARALQLSAGNATSASLAIPRRSQGGGNAIPFAYCVQNAGGAGLNAPGDDGILRQISAGAAGLIAGLWGYRYVPGRVATFSSSRSSRIDMATLLLQ